MTKPKLKPKLNLYTIIEERIESGITMGWMHAHKYTDAPEVDSIYESLLNDIMQQLSEVIDWGA